MHPPAFRIQQLLSDWPDCYLEMICPSCERKAIYPVSLMRQQHGDHSFEALLRRLRCKACRVTPAPVYLCASHHRVPCGGPTPDWAVLLVPAPRPRNAERPGPAEAEPGTF